MIELILALACILNAIQIFRLENIIDKLKNK